MGVGNAPTKRLRLWDFLDYSAVWVYFDLLLAWEGGYSVANRAFVSKTEAIHILSPCRRDIAGVGLCWRKGKVLLDVKAA